MSRSNPFSPFSNQPFTIKPRPVAALTPHDYYRRWLNEGEEEEIWDKFRCGEGVDDVDLVHEEEKSIVDTHGDEIDLLTYIIRVRKFGNILVKLEGQINWSDKDSAPELIATTLVKEVQRKVTVYE